MNSVNDPHGLEALVQQFEVLGSYRSSRPYGNGHINDTYAVTCDFSGQPIRYIFQRINHHVFRDIPRLMENIQRVTTHAQHRIAAQAGSYRTLRIIPTKQQTSYYLDSTDSYWRCYDFVENARTYEVLEAPKQAREAAIAFGEFQSLLTDLPGPRLHETIPHFHATGNRLLALEHAIDADPCNRASAVRNEIKFALERQPTATVLSDLQQRGSIPERITHNDTKLNNVLLDARTGHAVCVIDLDTVMPGLALYDFGDLVRSAANTSAEDETDLAQVSLSLPVFQAITEGYLTSVGHLLNKVEIQQLAFSARLITYEVGIRFLTDYLNGDIYFKTQRQDHNLDRCRCQFALLKRMEEQFEEMQQLVERLA